MSLSGSVTVASGGIWTGGGGTFNPNNTSLTTYHAQCGGDRGGQCDLTLTSVGNGNSNPVSDQVVITITPSPVARRVRAHQLRQPAERPARRYGERCHRWSLERRQVVQPVGCQPERGVHAESGGDRGGQRGADLTTTGNGLCNAVSDQVTLRHRTSPGGERRAGPTDLLQQPHRRAERQCDERGWRHLERWHRRLLAEHHRPGRSLRPRPPELGWRQRDADLTGTGNGTCAAVSDDVLLVFSQSPTVNAWHRRHVCANCA